MNLDDVKLMAGEVIFYVEGLAIKEVQAGAKKWLGEEKFKVACDLIQERIPWCPRGVIEAAVRFVFGLIGDKVNQLGKAG